MTTVETWDEEMLWDCKGGHKGQLGRHTSCQVCGRPKEENDDYYDKGEARPENAVTDPQMKADAQAGALWKCRYCGCAERRNDNSCKNCGVSQDDGDKERFNVDKQKRFDEVNNPFQGVTNPYFEPSKPSSPPDDGSGSPPKRSRIPFLQLARILVGIVGAAFLVWCVVWLFTPHKEIVQVTSVHWERSVHIDLNQVVHDTGFYESEPNDAFNVQSLGMRFHHTDHRLVGNHIEHYTRSEVCGQTCRPIPRVCVDVPKDCSTSCTSSKNGYKNCSKTCTGGGKSCSGGGQSCNDKYCDVDHTRRVDDYQDFPIMHEYFSWDMWRWLPERNATSQGDTLAVNWPEFSLSNREREHGRDQSYRVIFTNRKGETWTQNPGNETEFARFIPTSSWTLMVDHMGVVHSLTPR